MDSEAPDSAGARATAPLTGPPHPHTVQAGHYGMAVGRADHVSYYAASRAPASWPLQVGTVPAAARGFQHRPALDGLLGPTVRCGVLVGTAGVGKTQQAARLARAAWDEGRLDLLLWVTATDREAVVAAYAQAAAEITGFETTAPEQGARSFLAWLTPAPADPRRRWLVVLDGVADPEDVRGLWPPGHPDGRTLVTTSRRDLAQPGAGRWVVPVGGFTQTEATAHLRDALAVGGRSGRPGELEELARGLGRLPLALAQAAAHLVGAGIDCAEYARLLRPGTGGTLAELVPGPGALPDGQPLSLHEAWRESLDRAERTPRTGGHVRPLLELASVLPPEGAPEAVFTGPAVLRYLEHYRAATAADVVPVHVEDVRTALEVLDRLCLIEYLPADTYRAVRVHPVLQRATREAPAARVPYWTAASALVEAGSRFRDDPAFTPFLVRAVGLSQELDGSALWSTTPHWDTSLGSDHPSGAHEVLLRMGELLGEADGPEAAQSHFRQLADEALRRHGPKSSVFYSARKRLAHWQGEAGDAAGAAAAHAALLGELVQAVDPAHEHTFSTRAALGHWRARAGDPAGAAAAYAELAPLQARQYGPGYSDVVDTRVRAASLLGEAGDAYGAAIAYEALLHDLLRHLAPQGGPRLPRWSAALGMLVRNRPDWSDVFGAHFGHAHWRGRAGDPVGAATSLTHLLNEQVRVLGPAHPDTAATREELARWAPYTRSG
ncbi:tetratricopeptide repeat protein [Streptomyces sp. ISL-66]|uniref:tetratricopeptide repeat protein n=1 Tax=Streptomyces sp. ISL-66 TaxID=2819186 RepID=UPI001BE7367A|nr:tetratricopeptide repeat protein [Streptomyces sp. ISL-66]MBT2467311.1 tetratricopeptide repeat protein [Streptomyces sp. ISL-66]